MNTKYVEISDEKCLNCGGELVMIDSHSVEVGDQEVCNMVYACSECYRMFCNPNGRK